MKPNRRRLIRIAHSRPETREALLPLIRELGKTAANRARIDLDIEPEVGMVLVVADDPEFHQSEVLYWVETEDKLGEGSVIFPTRSQPPYQPGTRLVLLGSKARPKGGSWVGDVAVKKV